MPVSKASDAVYEAVRSLRVVRAFRPDPIPAATLGDILEAGRWTGSSKNRQAWGIIVVEGSGELERLATAGQFTDPIRASAVSVALVKDADGNDFDIGRLAQNLMLAAAARGVGSCPVTLHHTNRSHEILDLPSGTECRYAVALGFPDENRERAQRADRRERGVAGRRDLDDVVHHGSWRS
jgi:nitroreductase